MKGGSNSRGAVMEDGIIASTTNNQNNINEQEMEWEVRPGGMLVQKRDDDSQYLDHGIDGPTINIKVSHGSNQLDLTVPSHSTFGDLKRAISQQTGLEPKEQKILFRGKEKEDQEYLHMAGVKDNSKVLLMQDSVSKETNPEEMNGNTELSRGGEAVAEVRSEIDKLAEQVSASEAVVYGGTKVAENDIVYLLEMLMKQLLKLDSIDAAGEGKMQRKMEVRRIQRYVETLDTLKARNSNPFGNNNNAVSVTTQWETFESGVESLHAPAPMPSSTHVTEDWEQFD